MDIVEQSVKDVSDMFAACLQEAYKGYHPDTRFSIIASYPKFVNSYKLESNLHLMVSSELADQNGLNNKVVETRHTVIDCVNNKLQSYKVGLPLDAVSSYRFEITHKGQLKDKQPIEFNQDKTEFLHTIEVSLKRNFYAKIYNIRDVVKEIIFVERMLNLITEMDIRDLISYLYRHYEKSQIDDFVNKHSQEIIECVKEILKYVIE